MRCNGLPNAQQPSDLRKYIHIWLEKIEKFNLEEKNWLLQIDETSILTQNQTVKNLTKISLKKQQPILGDIYAERIVEVLGVSFADSCQQFNSCSLIFPDLRGNARGH